MLVGVINLTISGIFFDRIGMEVLAKAFQKFPVVNEDRVWLGGVNRVPYEWAIWAVVDYTLKCIDDGTRVYANVLCSMVIHRRGRVGSFGCIRLASVTPKFLGIFGLGGVVNVYHIKDGTFVDRSLFLDTISLGHILAI
jgi:hypothetical protein